jgi:hypothetical protein
VLAAVVGVLTLAGVVSGHAASIMLWALLGLYFAFGILIVCTADLQAGIGPRPGPCTIPFRSAIARVPAAYGPFQTTRPLTCDRDAPRLRPSLIVGVERSTSRRHVSGR